MLETVVLGLDELEAIRLADLEGLYQEEAAERMGISRPTFGRLVGVARRKVADALFHGRALAVTGGTVHLGNTSWFSCTMCGQRWCLPPRAAPPVACSECGSEQVSGVPHLREHPGRRRGARGGGRGRRGRA